MKIGILGGSFDPIHYGHISMARFCLENCGLDKIMFLPLGDPPHKTNITDKHIRIEMLESAIKEHPDFFVERIEADRVGKTYTFETVSELTSKSDDEYFYIIGSDTVNTLHTWFRAEELFKLISFIVVVRPDCDIEDGVDRVKKMGAKLHFCCNTGVDISSTKVRECIKNKEDITSLVPDSVAKLIEKYGLYKDK